FSRDWSSDVCSSDLIRLNDESYGGQVEQIFEWPRDNGEAWLMAVVDVAGTPRLFRVREDQGYRLEEVARLASPRVGYFFLQDKQVGRASCRGTEHAS